MTSPSSRAGGAEVLMRSAKVVFSESLSLRMSGGSIANAATLEFVE